MKSTVDLTAPATGATLSSSDEDIHVFDPTSDIDVTLDNTYVAGNTVILVNESSTSIISILASNGSTIRSLYPETSARVICTASQCVTELDWTPQGVAHSSWIDFTPTGSWPGADVTYSGKWRRIGESAEIQFRLEVDAVPATGNELTFDLPSGLVIDTAKLVGSGSDGVGIGSVSDVGSDRYATRGVIETTTSVEVFYFEKTTGNPIDMRSVDLTNPISSLAVGDLIDLVVTVPIVGWSPSRG